MKKRSGDADKARWL